METDRFAQLIDERLAVLVQLLALARRQTGLIDDSDLSALLKVLAGKQRLVTQLQSLDRQLAPFSQVDADSRVWATGEVRERCKQQAARCEAVLRQILATERQAEEQMILRRDETAERLAAMNQATHAQRAYVAAPLPPSTSLDLTSED